MYVNTKRASEKEGATEASMAFDAVGAQESHGRCFLCVSDCRSQVLYHGIILFPYLQRG